jgi:FlaG/FlaF family flagellin (archaellin)
VIAVIIAVVVALAARYSFHKGLTSKATSSGVGSAQIVVDTHDSLLSSLNVPITDEDLNTRASLYAE